MGGGVPCSWGGGKGRGKELLRITISSLGREEKRTKYSLSCRKRGDSGNSKEGTHPSEVL